MRPKQPDTANGDLFRSSLEAILDSGHELIRLAKLRTSKNLANPHAA